MFERNITQKTTSCHDYLSKRLTQTGSQKERSWKWLSKVEWKKKPSAVKKTITHQELLLGMALNWRRTTKFWRYSDIVPPLKECCRWIGCFRLHRKLFASANKIIGSTQMTALSSPLTDISLVKNALCRVITSSKLDISLAQSPLPTCHKLFHTFVVLSCSRCCASTSGHGETLKSQILSITFKHVYCTWPCVWTCCHRKIQAMRNTSYEGVSWTVKGTPHIIVGRRASSVVTLLKSSSASNGLDFDTSTSLSIIVAGNARGRQYDEFRFKKKALADPFITESTETSHSAIFLLDWTCRFLHPTVWFAREGLHRKRSRRNSEYHRIPARNESHSNERETNPCNRLCYERFSREISTGLLQVPKLPR